MNYAEEIVNLRKRILDAVNAGVVDPQFKDFYEATLLQILNESERQRQACTARAEDLRRQASVLDGQTNAFAQLGSIIYAVLNGYIKATERAHAEEIARHIEKHGAPPDAEPAVEPVASETKEEKAAPGKKPKKKTR